jgi:LPS export ABC transporter protein LptC
MIAWWLLPVALFALGCGDETPENEPLTSTGVEREIRDFFFSETQEGRLLWELRADYAFRAPRNPDIELRKVHVTFYDELGAVSSVLTSREGIVNEQRENLTARQDVMVISVAGDTLTTEELHFDKEQDLIHGPEFVRLAQPDRVLTGIGFRSNPDLSDYEVEKDVRISLIDRDGVIDDAP